MDADGVALGAIQGLNAKLEAQDQRTLAQLRELNDRLQPAIESLGARNAQLERQVRARARTCCSWMASNSAGPRPSPIRRKARGEA